MSFCNISGHFQSLKCNKSVWFSSRLCLDFLYLLDYLPVYLDFDWNYDKKIRYRKNGKDKFHQPNFVVTNSGRPTLVDCQYLSRTRSDEQRLITKELDQFTSKTGIEYQVITEVDIYEGCYAIIEIAKNYNIQYGEGRLFDSCRNSS